MDDADPFALRSLDFAYALVELQPREPNLLATTGALEFNIDSRAFDLPVVGATGMATFSR